MGHGALTWWGYAGFLFRVHLLIFVAIPTFVSGGVPQSRKVLESWTTFTSDNEYKKDKNGGRGGSGGDDDDRE